MRLKKLTLQGYKTFASKTEFIFDEGITAIVGPNGSGKSNVADAVRWVLGEQSYGTLRGKRTTDMIFAGSPKRPRSGMAQAILTLDNTDGWLPIDYTEVEIGRRAHRSGENEYLLNGQKVRLKDITELLATSGLAQRTYTIIGQGLVDKALSLRAEERRALFEEAAGIHHYKTRRAETLRRLSETRHNLERVHDILNEIRPRMNSLKRQARRATNYQQISQDLHHLLRIWYGFKWEQAKDDIRLAQKRAAVTEKAWQDTRQEYLVQQSKIDVIRRRLVDLREKTAVTRQQREEIREQLEQTRRQVAILSERQQSLQRQLTDIEQELPDIAKQHHTAQTDLAAATADLETAQANFNTSQAELTQFNATFQNQQAAINRWQKKLRQVELKQRNNQTKLAQAEGQLTQLQERLKEQSQQATAKPTEETVSLEKRSQKLTAVFQAAQSKSDELRQKRDKVSSQHQELIRDLKTGRRAINNEQKSLNKRRQQLARLEARVDMLDQMRHKESHTKGSARSLGQLATLITIPEAYETALSAALTTRLTTIILPDERNLWQLIQDNPKQALTAVSLDAIQAIDKPTLSHQHIIGWADELITCNPVVKPLVDRLLGQILIVTEQQTAFQLAQELPPGGLAVTPAGFIAHADGLVEQNSRSAQNNILAQETEWRETQAESERQQAALASAEAKLAEQQANIDINQKKADKLQNEERRLSRLLNENSQRLSQAQRDLDRIQQQQTYLKQQEENKRQETERLENRIQTVSASIESHRASSTHLEQELEETRAALAALPVAEAQQQKQVLQQQIGAASTIVAGRQAVVDSRRATLQQVERQRQRLQDRLNTLRQQQQNTALADAETTQKGLQKELARLDEALTPLQTELDKNQREMALLEEETADINKFTHERETQYTQAKIALSQKETAVEGLQERIKADLGIVALSYADDQTGATPLPISEVVEELPVVTTLPSDIETTIQNYRGQLQRMGAINPDAPTEYEEVAQRHEFLAQQIEDLTLTDSQLREVITELDNLTSRAFGQTVDQVNAIFGETFTQLFGGGAARLVLTDPDDLTISGVDIIARLPNRREQGLGLLSGGERSLTAAALIFSLLKVSPTPFCIMDEVDAALDEANINRFRELLRELSLKSQFIVITHNRGTVQAAQTIYGISMGDDSTSQTISIKPEDYVKQEKLV